VDNVERNNIKITCNKFIKMSAIIFGITFVLGLIISVLLQKGFDITKTVWSGMVTSADPNNPGAGEYVAFGLLASLMAFFAEFISILLTLYVFHIVPNMFTLFVLIVSSIARWFQCGKPKKWKDETSKVLLYISLVVQTFFILYLISLVFSGFGLAFIILYIMIAVNIYAYVKNILYLLNYYKSRG
jgi:hypothetical protein